VTKSAGGRLLYLYGISASAPKVDVAGAIDGASRVEHASDGGLTAWFSRVSAEEFGANLASNMENLEWLSGASVRHQRVVAQIAASVTLLPARFGTVFTSEESLLEHLRARKDDLSATLARIDGTEEWGVKVYARATAASAPVQVASGRDYLRAKAATIQTKKKNELDADVVEFARELQQIAADAAPAGKVSGGQQGLEWQASFLLRKKDKPHWDRALKKWATKWGDSREIECTGPWPPYSFV
jgi:hypothetical protein